MVFELSVIFILEQALSFCQENQKIIIKQINPRFFTSFLQPLYTGMTIGFAILVMIPPDTKQIFCCSFAKK